MLWGGVLCKTVKPLKAALFSALLLFFLLLSATFISCAGGAGSPKGTEAEGTALAIKLPDTSKTLYEKEAIVSFTVTVSSGSFTSTKSAGKGETMLFSNLPVGNYSVKAYGKTAIGAVAAKCETSVTIVAGETTTTTLHLSRLDHWTVTFLNEDGSTISTQDVSDGYTVSKPADPTKEGYNFSGWRTSPTATSSFDFNTPITADTTLHAKFGIKTYKITFNYNGGTVGTATSTTVDADYNTSPTVPTTAPTRTAPDGSAYTFMNGWNESPDATTILAGLDPATADKTYYAVWSPKVKVTFDYNGGTNAGSTKKEVYPNKDTAPEVPASTEEPSKSGYKFMGWASTSNATVADNTVSTTPVSADTTYYAVWLPAYNITYVSTPYAVNSTNYPAFVSYTSDDGLASLPSPTLTGYRFDGWYTDTAFTPENNVTSIDAGTTGPVTLYAKWYVKFVADTHNSDSGSATPLEVLYGSTVASLSNTLFTTTPAKSHATSLGWFKSSYDDGEGTSASSTAYNFSAEVTEPFSLHVKWESTEITWVSDITLGTDYTSTSGAYKYYPATGWSASEMPAPTHTGLTFAGWYKNKSADGTTYSNKVESIAAGTSGEMTLYAKWTATVTILEYRATTEDPNPPQIGTAQTVIYGKKATKPSPDPTTSRASEGYTDFLGWQTAEGSADPTDFNFTTATITKDTVVFGKWKKLYTNFEGTYAEFLAAEFVPDNTAATAYTVKITSATNSQLSNIAKAIGKSSYSNYKGVYINLDLSDCGATEIPSGAFKNDSSYAGTGIATYLTGIVLPSGLQKLNYAAFMGCSGIIGNIVIPDTVTDLGDYTFRECSGITGINIPSGITELKQSVFESSGITSIVIPSTVTKIESSACENCSGITGAVTIPNSVTEIGSRAFQGCSGITGITIPDGVSKIGSYAFQYCSGITGTITIPDSVTEIGNSAFKGCSSITDFTVTGTWDGHWLDATGTISDADATLTKAKLVNGGLYHYIRQ